MNVQKIGRLEGRVLAFISKLLKSPPGDVFCGWAMEFDLSGSLPPRAYGLGSIRNHYLDSSWVELNLARHHMYIHIVEM